MPVVTLLPHPETPCSSVCHLTVHGAIGVEGQLELQFRLSAPLAEFRLPAANPAPGRRDELWRQTCFEAFIRTDAGPGYWECNFSPSGVWAVYRFDSYRSGMAAAELPEPPRIRLQQSDTALTLTAHLPQVRGGLIDPSACLKLGLATVLESADGRLSYWALHHPAGQPDFHHADAFAWTVQG